MSKNEMTIKDATHRWVMELNSFPLDMIQELIQADPDEWEEVTKPSETDRVYVSDLPDGSRVNEYGEIESIDEESYIICLDNGDKVACNESNFSIENDSYLPMWGWMWSFTDPTDVHWMEELDGIRAMSQCGFRVFYNENWGYFFGIDGAGYDFYESHWIPAYKCRGLQWHDKEEKMDYDVILAQILDCGTSDLYMLKDVNYDLKDLIKEIVKERYYPDLNTVLGAVFSKGFDEFSDIVYEKVNTTENDYETCAEELRETAENVLDDLYNLNPMKDIWWVCNCADSHIGFANNGDLYRKYFRDDIEKIESEMGFCFED